MLTFRDVAIAEARSEAMLKEAELERLIHSIDKRAHRGVSASVRLRLFLGIRLLTWGKAMLRQAEVQGSLLTSTTQDHRSPI